MEHELTTNQQKIKEKLLKIIDKDNSTIRIGWILDKIQKFETDYSDIEKVINNDISLTDLKLLRSSLEASSQLNEISSRIITIPIIGTLFSFIGVLMGISFNILPLEYCYLIFLCLLLLALGAIYIFTRKQTTQRAILSLFILNEVKNCIDKKSKESNSEEQTEQN